MDNRDKKPELTTIKKIFSGITPEPIGINNKFAVLIPLIKVNGQLSLLFQVRSKYLNSQPGEISFPGGALEKGESFFEACIRETCEELNLNKSCIKVFGNMNYLITPYSYMIKPFTGYLEKIIPSQINYNKEEVERIFTVPLDFFLKNSPELHYVQLTPKTPAEFPYHKIPGGKNYPLKFEKYPVYFYEYKGYNIWGVTARLINNFVNTILENTLY